MKCVVIVRIAHPTGSFRFEADDVYFEFGQLIAFAGDLRRIAGDGEGQAFLVCMSNFFRLVVVRYGRTVRIDVEAEDYVPGFDNPRLSGNSVCDDVDLLNQWSGWFAELAQK